MDLAHDPAHAVPLPNNHYMDIIDLISSDDQTDYGDEDEEDLHLADLPARPIDRAVHPEPAARLPSPAVQEIARPNPPARRQSSPLSVISLSESSSPEPPPAIRLLAQQPARFEPIARPAVRPPIASPEVAGDQGWAQQIDGLQALEVARPANLAMLQAERVQARNRVQAGAVGGPKMEEEDLDEELLDQFLDDDFVELPRVNGIRTAQPPTITTASAPPFTSQTDSAQTLEECINIVTTLFPGICQDYVSSLYPGQATTSDRMIAHILDKSEKGTPWPKAQNPRRQQKRKREPDEDEEAALKYGSLDRVVGGQESNTKGLRGLIRDILGQEFAETPMTFIDATLVQSGFRLFSAYRVLEEAERTFDIANPAYNKIKPRRKSNFRADKIQILLNAIDLPPDRRETFEELVAARRIRGKADQKREDERQLLLAEDENTRRAEADGTMGECGCCYGDYPFNRMIHCDGEEAHCFCRQCALKNAETEIGNSKYELTCMSMDGCTAGFSKEQRSHFLTENTVVALERNEQEAVLRMAGIENLASCPFCPYAAEYPPIEVNKDFECKMPDCEKISCRLCNLESHIPKSCEEFAKENGLSIRREIEEAMTAALIRKCNKCETPFIKDEGCNKMTCTRPGCRNIQCYVCSKSCGYDHFDDRSRGGKVGNCPLFENAEQRHDQEVKEAERIALAKVRAENPGYTDDDLRVKVSENVIKDDERRKANDPRALIEARMVEARAMFALNGGNDFLVPPRRNALVPVNGPQQAVPALNNHGNAPRADRALPPLLRMPPRVDGQQRPEMNVALQQYLGPQRAFGEVHPVPPAFAIGGFPGFEAHQGRLAAFQGIQNEHQARYPGMAAPHHRMHRQIAVNLGAAGVRVVNLPGANQAIEAGAAGVAPRRLRRDQIRRRDDGANARAEVEERRIEDLGLFPPPGASREERIAFYQRRLGNHGPPIAPLRPGARLNPQQAGDAAMNQHLANLYQQDLQHELRPQPQQDPAEARAPRAKPQPEVMELD